MLNFHIIIPARLGSTRLPGKALIDIQGKPLIQRVYDRALLCGAKSITIATDDARIESVAQSFGANVCMTSITHQCGTERLAEAVVKLGLLDEDIVVNLQGDEPLVPIDAVQQTVENLINAKEAAMATLCTPILHPEEIFNINLPKVVIDKNGFALYFSRAAIPWNRDEISLQINQYFRHIGLYAYRVSLLKEYRGWGICPLEEIEKLEQLRILWHGYKIQVSIINEPLPAGVDTAADLERMRELFPLPSGEG